MQEIADVYARSLFEVASEQKQLDVVKEQLGQFADALNSNRDIAIFFFSPYFSAAEKKDGLKKAIDGALPIFENFLEALIERHRMPVIFRIRVEYEKLWDKANKRLPVSVKTAVPLDPATLESIGARIGGQTGEQVELTATVDPDIIGGIVLRVGNRIMDASIHSRLEQLRQVASQA
jgi:ATP synthase F1 delta subunit